ncbi:MAG: EI24 domain-containing protein [Bacteriovoracia bacterium]
MTKTTWIFPRSRSFWYGFRLPLEAASLILRQRSLLALSALPITLTLALYFFVIRKAIDYAQTQLGALIARWSLDPEGWAAWGAQWTGRILLFVVAALTFSFVSAIIASPFNDFLAERAERYGQPALPPVGESTWVEKLRLIWIDVAKSVAAGITGIAALVFSWVPVLNVIAFVVAFLLVCFQYTSYPQTRRGQSLRQGLYFLWRHFYACVGFGAAMTLLFAIPLAASFFLPVAVVGGTLLVARAPGSGSLFRLK